MKYISILITLLFCAGVYAQAQGPVAHWDFNGNVNDVTGNGHTGNAQNLSYGNGKLGQPNTAGVFNGTNSIVEVPYQADLNMEKITICAVIKPTGYYSGECQSNRILSRGQDHAIGHYDLQYSDNAFDNVDCGKLDTGKTVFYGNFRNKALKVPNSVWQYSPTIVTQNWYCVVSTYDGDTNKVYVDGVLMTTAPLTSGTIDSTTDGIALGASMNNDFNRFPYWLNGVVDDIKLYNRVLSESEVSEYCNSFVQTSDTTDTTTSVMSVILEDRDVNVYPVPAKGSITIATNIYHPDGTIAIYNSVGIKLIEEKHTAAKTSVNVSNLNSGIYLITLTTPDGQRVSRKLFIQ